MAFIETVAVHEASGDVQTMYRNAQGSLDYVPNYAKLFSLRPQVMATWGAFLASIRMNIDLRRYELVTLAAARALKSSYCMLAHGSILHTRFYTSEQLQAVMDDGGTVVLSAADAAIIAYAEHIVRDASSITEQEVQGLRDHGLTDAEIFDVAAVAAVRCFFSKLLDALGAEADSAYAEMETELRTRLTAGRPISTAPGEFLAASSEQV